MANGPDFNVFFLFLSRRIFSGLVRGRLRPLFTIRQALWVMCMRAKDRRAVPPLNPTQGRPCSRLLFANIMYTEEDVQCSAGMGTLSYYLR